MKRERLLTQLSAHRPIDALEATMLSGMIRFISDYQDCHSRSLRVGHLTGASWIVDRDLTHVLLLHHAKLNKWLQPGGHMDEGEDVVDTALRESAEETGLGSLALSRPEIFDVDIHLIPERREEPEHFHYDVRYLVVADRSEPLVISTESRALKWIELHDVGSYTTEESVLRMVRKTASFAHG